MRRHLAADFLPRVGSTLARNSGSGEGASVTARGMIHATSPSAQVEAAGVRKGEWGRGGTGGALVVGLPRLVAVQRPLVQRLAVAAIEGALPVQVRQQPAQRAALKCRRCHFCAGRPETPAEASPLIHPHRPPTKADCCITINLYTYRKSRARQLQLQEPEQAALSQSRHDAQARCLRAGVLVRGKDGGGDGAPSSVAVGGTSRSLMGDLGDCWPLPSPSPWVCVSLSA